MSGIAGIIRFDGAPVEHGLAEGMTSAIAHRGPDGIHHWTDGRAALGHCMLYTTAESLEEQQPFPSTDGALVLVMDGRVDNWMELRAELLRDGAVLRGRSDAELVFNAYERWGFESLARIDGDFALVIWDARRQTAFCARDRMGNKPFVYHWDGHTLAFASEVKALLTLPWVKAAPNESMLVEYLAGEWLSRDETLWSGILRLVAAHRMAVTSTGPRPEQYWEPDPFVAPPYQNDGEFTEHYRELLLDTVRRASRSHRPLAIQVSGGLDSSGVAGAAAHLARLGQLPAPGLEGYSAAYDGPGPANEVVYARAVAEHLALPIHEVPAATPPLALYDDLAGFFREFPGFPIGAICVDLMAPAAARGSRVTLTGQGGDHWLQGSRAYYAEELSARRWPALRACFDADASAFGTGRAAAWLMQHGVYPRLPLALREAVRRAQGRAVSGEEAQPDHDAFWLAPEMRNRLAERGERYRRPLARPVRTPVQHRLFRFLDDPLMAQVVERFDREGARAGLDVRHPLRSARFVEFAFATPERLRLRGGRTKYIHVQALGSLLPPAVARRKTKAEFSTVFSQHLNGMKEELTQAIPSRRPDWVSAEGMAELYGRYQQAPDAGWEQWVLWGVFGCDRVLR